MFVKVFGFLSFAKNKGQKIGKNINKNLCRKCSQKILDHAKQSATYAFKTVSKTKIQKTAETTDDLIGNKITDKIARILKASPKNNLEMNEEEILREKVIDNLRLEDESF